MSPRTALVLLAVLTAALPPPRDDARACATAAPKGQHVEIARESAIVIWDAANKTQHFIRRASFNTASSDFAFLVPTPARPQLAEADDRAFALLETVTAPQVVTRVVKRDPNAKSAEDKKSEGKSVRVLETKRVAGLDATVLEADDPAALADWLLKRGYPSSPFLTRWLGPYVANRWKVTAFQIARDPKGPPGVATSALRMTFRTERPYFPYREPEDQRSGEGARVPRLLRVYFLAEGRVQGTLGEKGNWPGKAVWANRLAPEQRLSLLGLLKLPPQTPPAAAWLTEFEDRAAPRPGTDEIYFTPSADQSAVAREPIVHIVYRDEPRTSTPLPTPTPTPTPTDTSIQWWLYVLGACFVAVVIAVVIWLLLARKGNQVPIHRPPHEG